MAQTRTSRPIVGFTRFPRPTGNTASVGPAAAPGGLILNDNGGFDYYLWMDTSGRLRTTDATTAEASNFNWNSSGTIVGTQS